MGFKSVLAALSGSTGKRKGERSRLGRHEERENESPLVPKKLLTPGGPLGSGGTVRRQAASPGAAGRQLGACADSCGVAACPAAYGRGASGSLGCFGYIQGSMSRVCPFLSCHRSRSHSPWTLAMAHTVAACPAWHGQARSPSTHRAVRAERRLHRLAPQRTRTRALLPSSSSSSCRGHHR